jgi:hypothetical protein
MHALLCEPPAGNEYFFLQWGERFPSLPLCSPHMLERYLRQIRRALDKELLVHPLQLNNTLAFHNDSRNYLPTNTEFVLGIAANMIKVS